MYFLLKIIYSIAHTFSFGWHLQLVVGVFCFSFVEVGIWCVWHLSETARREKSLVTGPLTTPGTGVFQPVKDSVNK